MTVASGQHPVKSMGRECIVFSYAFDTNGTSAPDGLEDPLNVVSSMAYSATGLQVATLNHRYARIHAVCQGDTGTEHARVTAVTDGGAAANTITVGMFDDAGPQAAVESNNHRVVVTVFAYPYT